MTWPETRTSAWRLGSFDADGDSFTLTQNGQTTIPITRGQNNTTAGISAALQGGNEQQQVILTGNDNPGDSFTLTHGANTTAPFVRGTNQTQAAIQTALQGISEVQTATLTGYDGTDSFTLSYNGGASSHPIVRGQNNTTQGIQNALQGGNEVQTVTLTNFNPATANFQLRFNGGFAVSPVIGAGGLAYTAFNIDAAINGLSGFAGGAATSAVTNSGFTLTFSGASANTNTNAVEVINIGGCPTCTVAEPRVRSRRRSGGRLADGRHGRRRRPHRRRLHADVRRCTSGHERRSGRRHERRRRDRRRRRDHRGQRGHPPGRHAGFVHDPDGCRLHGDVLGSGGEHRCGGARRSPTRRTRAERCDQRLRARDRQGHGRTAGLDDGRHGHGQR